MSLRWALICSALLFATPALAQDKGTLDPKPLPPLAHPDDPSNPAKALFGRATKPAPLATRTIGFYSHGCLAGGLALPVNGPDWQVMRLSRNTQLGPSRPDRLSRAFCPASAAYQAVGLESWSATCRSRAAAR